MSSGPGNFEVMDKQHSPPNVSYNDSVTFGHNTNWVSQEFRDADGWTPINIKYDSYSSLDSPEQQRKLDQLNKILKEQNEELTMRASQNTLETIEESKESESVHLQMTKEEKFFQKEN